MSSQEDDKPWQISIKTTIYWRPSNKSVSNSCFCTQISLFV